MLMFFHTSKVASTEFKTLLRRMMNDTDLPVREDIHTEKLNGAKHLFHYNLKAASQMISSPEWTRAIFLRDPKERILSAYLSKVKYSNHYEHICCRAFKDKEKDDCVEKANTFESFIKNVTDECDDVHWRPQKNYVGSKYWPRINFVGRFSNLAKDTETLLRSLGGDAWETYGETGWGADGKMAVFVENSEKRATYATSLTEKYYTTELEDIIKDKYAEDYELLNHFNATN